MWGLREQLLALIADRLEVGNWLFTSANSEKKPPRPKPIPRPGVESDEKARDAILARAKRFQERQRQQT